MFDNAVDHISHLNILIPVVLRRVGQVLAPVEGLVDQDLEIPAVDLGEVHLVAHQVEGNVISAYYIEYCAFSHYHARKNTFEARRRDSLIYEYTWISY